MLQNNTLKIVVGGITVISLSYITYQMWKRYIKQSQSNNKRKNEEEQRDNQRLKTAHSNCYSDYYFDKEEELRKIMILISDKGPTIEEVYLLSPRILVDEYVKYTHQIRKRRRLIRKVNEDQYISIVRNYEHEIKELLQRGRLQLLEEFGRSSQDLERMQSAFQMFEDIQDLKKKALAELKGQAALEKKLKKIPNNKLRKIIQEEISFIKNRMHERIKQKLIDDQSGVTSQEILSVVTTLIDDVICQKYGYEREQIEKQISQFPVLAKQLQKYRKMLFAEIGQFNQYSLNSEDEGSDQEQADQKNAGSDDFQTEILEQSIEQGKQRK